MENKLHNLKEKMNGTILQDVYFDENLEQRVIGSIETSKFRKQSPPLKNRFNALLSVAVTTMFFVGIAYFVGMQLQLFKESQGNQASELKGIVDEGNVNIPSNRVDIPNDTIKEKNLTTLPLFELTANEEKAYENFQNDFNVTHLNGLEPISVAKLYVKAGFEKKYAVQYALYTDREGYIQWSKEDDEKIPESDRGTNEQNLKQYKNIEKGDFVQTSDYEGYIEYDSSESSEATSGFKMIKNENGIWQVSFMPIQ